MKQFFLSWQFKVILLILVLLGGFAASSYLIGGKESWPAKLIGYIVTPIQSASSAVTDAVSGFFGNILRADELAKENEQLREEIADLREQLIDYNNTMRENQLYAYYLELAKERPDFSFCPADVVSRPTGDVYGSFVINKGALQDVALYDPVITDAGLVGYICELSDTYARVMTLLDVDFKAAANNIRNLDSGMISGNTALAPDGLCEMRYIVRDSDTAVGDLVTTTGMTGMFPRDLVVGTVLSLRQSSQGVSLTAVIQPAVQLDEITSVFVITDFEGQGNSLEDFTNPDNPKGGDKR